MSFQTWQESLVVATGDGTGLASFTTAASMLPAQARYTFPAGWFQVGRAIRVRAAGRVSNVVTAQPTFTVEFRLGPTANIAVFSGGAMLTSTTAHTNVPWSLEILLTCRAVGASTSANLMGQGMFISRAVLDAGATADATTVGHSELLIPETAPAVGTGFDSTVANLADLYVACSTSNAGNTWTCHQYVLESLN